MIDHLAINTSPELHEKTVSFYLSALEPLGYKKVMEFQGGNIVGLGDGSSGPDFWIAVVATDNASRHIPNIHFAFNSKDRKTVDVCYTKGLEAGGEDNGAPGFRPQYHSGYYGAFLRDPVGNAMEFVNHHEEGAKG